MSREGEMVYEYRLPHSPGWVRARGLERSRVAAELAQADEWTDPITQVAYRRPPAEGQ